MPAATALDVAIRSVDAFVAGLDVDGLSAERAAAAMQAVVRMRNMLGTAEVLLAPKAAHVLRRPGRDGAAQGLARLTGTSAHDARRTLDTARHLAGLSAVATAAARGELSARQVRDIVDAARHDPRSQHDLIATARRTDRQGLVEACRRVKDRAIGPEERHRRAHAGRSLVFGDDPDTGGRRAVLSTTRDAAAEIEAIVARYTEQVFRAARAAGRREPYVAYAADGLLAALRSADGTAPAAAVPVKAEIVIVVDRSALLRGHTLDGERCEIRGLGSIPVSVARTYMADAFLKGVLVDGVEVQHVRHFGRSPSAALRTALDLRFDGKCACGQCSRRKHLDYDHGPVPHALGAPHTYAGTQPLSRPEHRHKTLTIDMPLIRATRRAVANAGDRRVSVGATGPPTTNGPWPVHHCHAPPGRRSTPAPSPATGSLRRPCTGPAVGSRQRFRRRAEPRAPPPDRASASGTGTTVGHPIPRGFASADGARCSSRRRVAATSGAETSDRARHAGRTRPRGPPAPAP